MLWSDLVVSLSSKMFQKGLWCMRLYPQNQPLVTGPLQSRLDVGKGSNCTQKKIERLCKLQTPGKQSVIRYANFCFVKTIFVN